MPDFIPFLTAGIEIIHELTSDGFNDKDLPSRKANVHWSRNCVLISILVRRVDYHFSVHKLMIADSLPLHVFLRDTELKRFFLRLTSK